ncbi:FecR family protein [Pantoea rwandensis]|nr:FecR domain-containing protein [Pantoea rwandensis]
MMRNDNQTVAEQAIHWLLRQEEGMTRSEQAEFERWLQVPAHQAEFEDLGGLWQETAAIPASAVADLRPVTPRRRLWWPVMAACTFLFMTAILFFPLRDELASPIYSASWHTGRGEIRTVQLPDGSTLTLDAGTALHVRYFAHRREVDMPQGQAFFQIAHNPNQPFLVLSGPTRVTVVGTEFSVRYLPHTMSGEGSEVAVSSGAVRVGPRGGWENRWWRAMQHLHLPQAQRHISVLHASQRSLSDAQGRLVSLSTLPSESIAAWREDRIVLDNTRLDMALAEFARYRDVSLRLHSPSVAALRVSGSFDTERVDSFASALPRVLPVKIKVIKNQKVITSGAAENKNN